MALVGSETIDAENNEISDSIKSALKKFGLTENELRLVRIPCYKTSSLFEKP